MTHGIGTLAGSRCSFRTSQSVRKSPSGHIGRQQSGVKKKMGCRMRASDREIGREEV